MTRRVSAVHIAQPCPESWDAMTPTSIGRHCAACQKTVVDFSQKTDAEILAALRQAAGQTCGRLRPDQVNRPLIAPTPAPRWRAWLGAVLAAGSVLSAGRATAQASGIYANGGPAPAASSAPNQPSRVVTSTPVLLSLDEPMVLRGTVTDASTHEGLPGATVLLKGTNTGVSTDANGIFSLPLTTNVPSVQLTISSIGFVTQEQTATAGQPLAIALAVDVKGMMGEVVIIGGISQRPWPWHPRRFFNWSKYWLGKSLSR